MDVFSTLQLRSGFLAIDLDLRFVVIFRGRDMPSPVVTLETNVHYQGTNPAKKNGYFKQSHNMIKDDMRLQSG